MNRKHLLRVAAFVASAILTAGSSQGATRGGDHSHEADGTPTVGLVLSGGGAKGVAHVGVIKALEDNDIPIDYVTGTSMGSIVGSLYCCGWTPEQMMDFFTSTKFLDCSTGTIDPALTYYFSRPLPTPQWLSLNLSFYRSNDILGQVIPSSLINPLPMSIEFLELFTRYSAQCHEDFNRLFVPFRCVTSDIYHKHKIVLSKGSLGDAVRASMSFPLVYKPIEMDGVLVYDGGIYDNFPVNVMEQDFDPDFIIGVSVSAPDAKPQAGNIYEQLEDMIIQNNDYNVPADKGVKIQVPVLNFGVLDFPDAPQIYEIGYKTGLAMVDSIKKRTPARRPLAEVNRHRAEFGGKTPVIEYDSVRVNGVTKRQARYLRFLFDRGLNRPFGMEQAQNAFYRAVASGKIADLLPQTDIRSYKPSGALADHWGDDTPDTEHPVLRQNTLILAAKVKNPWNIGVGGWITSSTNSMLYLSFGYHTLNFNSLDIDLGGWLGQSYYAGRLSAKFTLQSRVPSYLELEGVASRQKFFENEIMFYDDDTPAYITSREQFVRLNYGAAIGRTGRAKVGVSYGHMSDSFYEAVRDQVLHHGRDAGEYKIAALKGGVEWNTLNNGMYPSSGRLFDANMLVSHERARVLPESMQGGGTTERYTNHVRGSLEVRWQHYWPLHRNFILGGAAQGMATLESLYQDYMATMVHCYAFAPTPSTRNYFNRAFRSDNFVAVGAIPIWQPMAHFQVRGDFHAYLPVRDIGQDSRGMARYDGWMRRMEFMGEVAAVYNFSFASLSLYVDYLSAPAHNWNFGINFGLYYQAPKLIR